MSDPANVVVQNCKYYLRIVTIFQVCLKQALLDVLHDPKFNGLPFNNQQQTHALLLAFRTNNGQKLKHVLRPSQWDIICHVCTNQCPQNCQRAGKTITIICVLLSNYLVGLPPPINGWKKALAPGDYSVGACGIRARELRNKTTGHGSYLHISTKQEFDDCCSEIEKILKGLCYKDMTLYEDLKTCSLDPYINARMEFFSNELKTMKMELAATTREQNAVNQLKLKAVQDACKLDNDAIKADLNDLNAKQTAMETKQTAMQLEINATNLIIDDLRNKLSHFEQSYDRSDIETTSVPVNQSQEDLKVVSAELKKKYIKKYNTVRLSLNPRKTVFEPVKEIERNKIVVKLSLVPTDKVFEMAGENADTDIEQDELSDYDLYDDDYWEDGDDTTLDNQNNIEINERYEYSDIIHNNKDSASSSITYKDIFDSHDDYVLIFGVPGCGKTTLVETILYEWSTDALWKEEFDFVFILYFRQLVKFRSDQNITCSKLLSHFYPGFDFTKISNHKTLLLLDGFDELACKHDFQEKPENFTPFAQAVYDLVDPNNPSIQFTRLLTSRPGSCPILFESVFKETFQQNLRLLKIIGFDDEVIDQYVHNHLWSNSVAEDFLIKLKESNSLQDFMRIPFFCWGICYLVNHEEVDLDKLPVTTTAIYANTLPLFIRNHGLRNPALKLLNLFQSKEFREMVFMLSYMAWRLDNERKLVFNFDDMKDIGDINLLIKSGLVIKVESESTEKDNFQFMHYSFQEFLCALHVFHNSNDGFISNKIMLAGLCGGHIQDSSSNIFVKSFASMKSSCFEFASIFNSLCDLDFISNAFYEYQNQTVKLYFPYFEISTGFHERNTSKISHFMKRCDDHLLSIDVLNTESFLRTRKTSEELDILSSILTCCATLECDAKMLFMLNDDKYSLKMKESGRLKNLYIHCYPNRYWSGDMWLQGTDPSEIANVLANLEGVKILGIDQDYYEIADRGEEEFTLYTNWIESFKKVINNMSDAERPRSFSCFETSFEELEEHYFNAKPSCTKSIFDCRIHRVFKP